MFNKPKNIVFVVLLILLALPTFQHITKIVKVKPLDGDFVLTARPDFTWKTWLSGDFQSQFDNYIEDHIGFRSFFVRLNNQTDFSIFRKANADGVVVGKDRMLFEYDYIQAYTGNDFIGKKTIRKKLNRVKFLQKYLKENFDIDFVVIFEPSKARFYPELIPDHYLEDGIGLSNYEYFTQEAKNLGVRFIDYNKYYNQLKGTKPYPLYPKWGIHWSEYGMSFVADSLVKYIENLRGIDLPEMKLDNLKVTNHLEDSDYDVGKTMNLLWRLPHPEVAYPQYSFTGGGNKTRPMVLTIADSYYWNIFNTRLPKNLFANEAFWYFNAQVYPDSYFGTKWVKDVDLRKEIEKQDIIILSVTERFLYKFDWGFVDDVFKLYAPPCTGDLIYDYANGIKLDATWFSKIQKKAQKQGIPLEDALIDEATFRAITESFDTYLSWYGLDHYKKIILNTPEWKEMIAKKAAEQGTSFDEMLTKDADYSFKNDHPAINQKYHLIQKNINAIKADRDWLNSVGKKAGFYFMDTIEMVHVDAEFMANQELGNLSADEIKIQALEKQIRQDPKWLELVAKKAAEKGITLDEMIHEDAKYMVEQEKK